jgi:hypothetical protein
MYLQRDVAGADWEYQQCIRAAAAGSGWDCRILAPADLGVSDAGVVPVLTRIATEAPLLSQWRLNLWQLPRDMQRAYDTLSAGGSGGLVLMAQCLGGCAAFCGFVLGAIRLRRHRPHVLAILRFPIANRWTTPVYRAGDRLLRVYGVRVTYLTDTRPLSASNGRVLGRPIVVLPIPHTDSDLGSHAAAGQAGTRLDCWWPGRPRPEKGLDAVRRLVSLEDRGEPRLCLIAADSAGLAPRPDGVDVATVPDPLSRTEYCDAMQRASVVLLPYDGPAYAERSSGIFVEAVVAGKIVLTSAGSWMASELERHGLGRFVIDWAAPDLPDRIRRVALEGMATDAFASVRQEYQAFHNVSSFTRVLSCALA